MIVVRCLTSISAPLAKSTSVAGETCSHWQIRQHRRKKEIIRSTSAGSIHLPPCLPMGRRKIMTVKQTPLTTEGARETEKLIFVSKIERGVQPGQEQNFKQFSRRQTHQLRKKRNLSILARNYRGERTALRSFSSSRESRMDRRRCYPCCCACCCFCYRVQRLEKRTAIPRFTGQNRKRSTNICRSG